MTERPIIFSGPMVRAILEGRKTQTRRVFKGRAYAWWQSCGAELNDDRMPVAEDDHGQPVDVPCPYGVPGDRLWVREAWAEWGSVAGCPCYKADGDRSGILGWKSPMFMPRRYARILLSVVGIRVERLQDISEADAIAEGIEVDECHHVIRPDDDVNWGGAVWEYASIWNRLNAKRGYPWESNPWVWVIEFEKGGV